MRATINLYNDDESYSFELSATQLRAVVMVLGITDATSHEITCFSDDTVERVISKLKGIKMQYRAK